MENIIIEIKTTNLILSLPKDVDQFSKEFLRLLEVSLKIKIIIVI